MIPPSFTDSDLCGFWLFYRCYDAASGLARSAAVLSFILSHQLLGVREGTVIAALLVGFIARKIGMLCNGLEEKLFPQTTKQKETVETKEQQAGPVIAIGRQFGCGGRAIADVITQVLKHKGEKYAG